MDYAGGVDEQMEANFYYYCDKQRNPGEIDLIIKQNDTLREYNKSRPNSGKYCYGKTPIQTSFGVLISCIRRKCCNIVIIFQTKRKYDKSSDDIATLHVGKFSN